MDLSAFSAVRDGLLHVNHASLLIKSDDRFLLCDPWYVSPAFSHWTQSPSPPSEIIRFIRSIGPDTLSCVVSHGHDDHFDDFFIKHHLSETTFHIPTFRSPGLQKRARRLLQRDPVMLTDEPTSGPFRLSRIINDDFTSFDSIIAIETDRFTVIHANDNWHELPPENIEQLLGLKARAKGPFYFLMQVGIADCFPHCYPQFPTDEVLSISESRVARNLDAVQSNMERLGLSQAYSYANQSRIISDFNKRGINNFGLVETAIGGRTWTETRITQLMPGLWFDLSQEPGEPKALAPSGADLLTQVVKALEAAADAYLGDAERPGPIRFEITGEFDAERCGHGVVYATDRITWQRIVTGAANLETISIGGGGQIWRFPKAFNIRDIHERIGNFGYIAQNKFLERGLSWLI